MHCSRMCRRISKMDVVWLAVFLDHTFQSDLSDIHIDGEGVRRVGLAVSYFSVVHNNTRQVSHRNKTNRRTD